VLAFPAPEGEAVLPVLIELLPLFARVAA